MDEKTKEELIKIMALIRDERMNILGEDDEEKSTRLDQTLSEIHIKLNELVKQKK